MSMWLGRSLVERGLYDIGWAFEKMCKGCDKDGVADKQMLYHLVFVERSTDCHRCASLREVRNAILDQLRNWEQTANT